MFGINYMNLKTKVPGKNQQTQKAPNTIVA
jgi:hypothetical protein